MKNPTPKTVLRIVGWGFLVLIVLLTLTTEYQGKWALRNHAKKGTALTDFFREYGKPRYAYPSWQSLPQPYQRLFVEPRQPEDTYYAYQKEGLPFYWSFVVSVDEDTQTVQRYIYWKAIALKPQ